ncbi:MAG: GTPase [Actinobacteria bacterium HGW-Actinobacteria-4]|nr:MAG: GTPase [Actinobacteria bacterium HGW-Actinobacteria-4]
MTDAAVETGDLNEDQIQQAFTEGYDEALEALGRFNLAIVGDTGVGKSTLVNAIFGSDRAATGIGAPITVGTEYHLRDDQTFGVWDFQGFEHGAQATPVETLRKGLKANQSEDPERAIHVAWFCWDASGARLTEGHRLLIRALADAGIPVIGVLTKVHKRGELIKSDHLRFAEYLEGENLGFADPHVYLTAALADAEFGLETHGLKKLLHATIALAPEAAKDAARRAQVIDAKLKRNLAWKWISAASASAAVIAATPIPVASAAVLAPLQLGMFGKIAAIYGLKMKDILGGGASFQVLLQLTGKAAAMSLVKFVPVAGSVINASVASVWTAAAGEAWRRMCEQAAKGDLKVKTFQEFRSTFGPVVEALFKSWMERGGKPEAPQ